jgi:nitrogen regulatory protein P-II 1
MKKIEAIIRPLRLQQVKAALSKIGVEGMTVSEVQSWSRVAAATRGGAGTLDFLPKIKIEIVLAESLVQASIAAIKKAAQTARMGDAKILVSTVVEAIRIRTAEKGLLAVGSPAAG